MKAYANATGSNDKDKECCDNRGLSGLGVGVRVCIPGHERPLLAGRAGRHTQRPRRVLPLMATFKRILAALTCIAHAGESGYALQREVYATICVDKVKNHKDRMHRARTPRAVPREQH